MREKFELGRKPSENEIVEIKIMGGATWKHASKPVQHSVMPGVGSLWFVRAIGYSVSFTPAQTINFLLPAYGVFQVN